MGARAKLRHCRQGFTLVEMLTVIVIIGILAGLILTATVASKATAKRAVIRTDISQLETALQNYKTEYGEYPPDFFGLTDSDPLVSLAAQQAINRHLRKRFPRFRGKWIDVVNTLAILPVNRGYGVDATQLDAASALGFWLGGLPENANSATPAGFHTDPSNPFKLGLPRSKPLFEFDPERYAFKDSSVLRCRYFPKGVKGVTPAPYVYFKSQRAPSGEQTYFYMQLIPPTSNPPGPAQYAIGIRTWPPIIAGLPVQEDRAVAYQDDNLAVWDNEARWESAGTYQIISAGLDGLYGTRATTPAVRQALQLRVVLASVLPAPASTHTVFSSFVSPATRTGDYFFDGDHDNLTSFADGKLEDQIE